MHTTKPQDLKKAHTPEQAHARQIQAAELNRTCAFLLGLHQHEIDLLLDVRLYAKKFNAKSEDERIGISHHVLEAFPECRKIEIGLGFRKFHNAMWTALPMSWNQAADGTRFSDERNHEYAKKLEGLLKRAMDERTCNKVEAIEDFLERNFPESKPKRERVFMTHVTDYLGGRIKGEISLKKRALLEAAIDKEAE